MAGFVGIRILDERGASGLAFAGGEQRAVSVLGHHDFHGAAKRQSLGSKQAGDHTQPFVQIDDPHMNGGFLGKDGGNRMNYCSRIEGAPAGQGLPAQGR